MASNLQKLSLHSPSATTSLAILPRQSHNTKCKTTQALTLMEPSKSQKKILYRRYRSRGISCSSSLIVPDAKLTKLKEESPPPLIDPTQTPKPEYTEHGKDENYYDTEIEDDSELPEEQEAGAPLNEVWREIQGCNDWEGLLDPMNAHLRREIIRYGEFAQACYDSFDFNPHSKYCGTCKYQGAHFFEKLHMADRGYQISRYLYATSNINLPNFFQKSSLSSVWSTHANWMGYVAVSTNEDEIKRLGRRDIVVAWRGTVTYLEWIYDLKDILCSANFTDDPSIKIELGFHDLYTKKETDCHYCTFSAREQILSEIKRLVDRYAGEQLSITFTGHSLGAALALLSAYDVAELQLNTTTTNQNDSNSQTVSKIPITVFSFAGPRVGNLKFKQRCDDLNIKVLRITNIHDKVPTVPGIITNEKFQYLKHIEDAISFPWSYAHVGVELQLDHTESPFLQPTSDLGCAHNLEAHLHLVDGFHGKGRRFKLATKRDIALVNKACDFLKRDYQVPPFWMQEANKGMVRGKDGRWAVPHRPRIEAHPPDMVHHLTQVMEKAASLRAKTTSLLSSSTDHTDENESVV